MVGVGIIIDPWTVAVDDAILLEFIEKTYEARLREGIEGTRVVLGTRVAQTLSQLSWHALIHKDNLDAIIHNDNQDFIYRLKSEIAKQHQCKTIGLILVATSNFELRV